MPVSPSLRRLRKEDHKFESSLYYIVRPCFKKPKEKNNRKRIVVVCIIRPQAIYCPQIPASLSGPGVLYIMFIPPVKSQLE
jgi:hypothetical protein